MSLFFIGCVLVLLCVIGVVLDMFLDFSMRGINIIGCLGVLGALCIIGNLFLLL